jgi:hypothetical protein
VASNKLYQVKGDVLASLLYTRKQVAKLLGDVDVSYVRRLEQEGVIKGFRLTRSPSARVFFRAEDVKHLIAKDPK